MTSDGLLFPEDRDTVRRRLQWVARSRIYGTPEFKQAYAIYIHTAKWKKLCRQVKERARGRCERCGPYVVYVGAYGVHHKTYDRFTDEWLTDLEYLCLPCHHTADRERERRNQRAYEEAGEEALEAARMNGFFRAKYGEDWGDHFGSDMASAYEEWDEQKRHWDDEGG